METKIVKKAILKSVLTGFFPVFLVFFALRHDAFSMEIDENNVIFNKILDDLFPVPELKLTNQRDNFSKILNSKNKHQLGNLAKLHKNILFHIFSYLSIDDLKRIIVVDAPQKTVFFRLAENRYQTFQEILENISHIYVTSDQLFAAYGWESLQYVLQYTRKSAKDFLQEDGGFKENWKELLKTDEEVVWLHDYSKVAIALGHEEIKKMLLNSTFDSYDFVCYVQFAAEIKKVDLFHFQTINGESFGKYFWDIGRICKNIDFVARNTTYNYGLWNVGRILVAHLAGVSPQKMPSYKQIESLQNHPKIESIRALIRYEAQFEAYPCAAGLIVNFIREKTLAQEYVDILLKRPFDLFVRSPLCEEYFFLRKIINLKEDENMIRIANTPAYFEDHGLSVQNILSFLYDMGNRELFEKTLLKEVHLFRSHVGVGLGYAFFKQIIDFKLLDLLSLFLKNVKNATGQLFNIYDVSSFKLLYEVLPDDMHHCLMGLILNTTFHEKIEHCYHYAWISYLAKMALYDNKEETKDFITQECKKIDILDIKEASLFTDLLSIFLRLEEQELAKKYFDLSIDHIISINNNPEKYEHSCFLKEYAYTGALSTLQRVFKNMNSLDELKTKEVFDIDKLLTEYGLFTGYDFMKI